MNNEQNGTGFDEEIFTDEIQNTGTPGSEPIDTKADEDETEQSDNTVVNSALGQTKSVRLIGINPRNTNDLLAAAAKLNISESVRTHWARDIQETGFHGSINITDLSEDLSDFTQTLRGTVNIKTSREQKAAPGSFTFVEGVEQRILLITGVTRTKAKKPDQFTGCPWGLVQTTFVSFPETFVDDNTLKAYRPILRFITQDFYDAVDSTGEKIKLTNSYFQVAIEELKSSTVKQLADMVFSTALYAGVPVEEMDVRPASWKERQEQEALRKQGVTNGRNANATSYGLPSSSREAEGFGVPAAGQVMTMPD